MFDSNYEKSVTECLEKMGINENTTCQCGAKMDRLSFNVRIGVGFIRKDKEKLNRFFNRQYPHLGINICNLTCNNCGM